ncbi:MAG: hypothetical protein ACI8R4_002144 [Paracoccaceae bacterium]|jgi:hypothetical protein
MAYLDETTLHCPACDHTDRIGLVVGVGPHSRPGDTPYRHYRKPGSFSEGTNSSGAKNGTLLCPKDGTIVWTDQAGQKATP